ncbi:MAG: hypothetical protein AB8B61_04095 [Cyclobacteriaceae bacterium]
MRTKRAHIILLLLTTMVFSCKKEEAIDKEIDTAIIGSWTNSIQQYSFSEDGKYNFLVVSTRDVDSLGLTLTFDSIVGDFYTIANKSIVIEPKLGRKISDNSIVNFSDIKPQVVNYSVADEKRLTFSSSTVEVELIKSN